jgi:hypothetical protein
MAEAPTISNSDHAPAGTVLAWWFNHIGDCNRYGNCVDHPYFERPTLAELEVYPDKMPNGTGSLNYVPLDAVTSDGKTESDTGTAYQELRDRSDDLRAAVGDAIHQYHRSHPERVEAILDSAASAFDRGRTS